MRRPNIPEGTQLVLAPEASWKPKDRAVLTLKEAGSILCLGQTTIFGLINKGSLRVIHIGRRTLVPLESIEDLLRHGA